MARMMAADVGNDVNLSIHWSKLVITGSRRSEWRKGSIESTEQYPPPSLRSRRQLHAQGIYKFLTFY